MQCVARGQGVESVVAEAEVEERVLGLQHEAGDV